MNAHFRKVESGTEVPRLALETNDMLVVRGTRLRPVRRTDGDASWVFERVDASDVFVEYGDLALWLEQDQPGYRHHERHFSVAAAMVRKWAGVSTLDDVPAHERPLIVWKFEWARALRDLLAERDAVVAERGGRKRPKVDDPHGELLRVSLSDAGLELAIDIIGRRRADAVELRRPEGTRGPRSGPNKRSGDQPPRKKALRTWLKVLRDAEWNPLILRLRYRKCGGGPKVSGPVEELMAKYAAGYAQVDQPTQRY